MSEPTWPNHPQLFAAAGFRVRTYPYTDPAGRRIYEAAMLDALGEASPGDVVLLHGACHNPTGVDPSADLWRRIGDLVDERGVLPLVDLAYQGFGDGLAEDERPHLLAVGDLAVDRPVEFGARGLGEASLGLDHGVQDRRHAARVDEHARAQVDLPGPRVGAERLGEAEDGIGRGCGTGPCIVTGWLSRRSPASPLRPTRSSA